MERKEEKTTARKALETTKKIRPLVKEWSRRSHEAEANGEPTAYYFVGGAYEEILRAMDIISVGTENYAALCAAKMDAERFLSKAEAEGYCRHLCSYATCWIGYDALYKELGGVPPNAPDGGMARPTVMLGTGMMICEPRYKGYQASQRYTDVPMHVANLLYPPFDADIDEVQDYYVKFIIEELKELVTFLEKHTGRKMNWDRLCEVTDLVERTTELWNKAYELRKAIPAPMPSGDAMSCMVPGRFYLGTQLAYDFYQELYNEIKYRVDNKIGVIPDEKYRLAWGAGLPPWFALRIFNYVETLGAVFAKEIPYSPWPAVEIPPSVADPLERIARRNFAQQTWWYRKAQKHTGHPYVERLLELIDEYKIDGVVFHRAYTCRTLHTGLLHQADLLNKYSDIPLVILEGDIVDARNFAEEEVKRKLATFIETVHNHKVRR